MFSNQPLPAKEIALLTVKTPLVYRPDPLLMVIAAVPTWLAATIAMRDEDTLMLPVKLLLLPVK